MVPLCILIGVSCIISPGIAIAQDDVGNNTNSVAVPSPTQVVYAILAFLLFFTL
jgi:hypothetical protein